MEQRKEKRIKVNLPIEISYQNKMLARTETENISRLGTYLAVEKKITIGIDVDIKLEIPDYSDKPLNCGEIRCKGNVFRCNPIQESSSAQYYGAGIFFTSFSTDNDKEKLSKYIDYLISQEDVAVKDGLKHWKDKRETAKAARQLHLRGSVKQASEKEVFDLLGQILKRLEEIKQLLQPK